MNRIEIKFNGQLIFGITAEIERPNSNEEFAALLEELKEFILDESSVVEDRELF